MPEWMFPFMAFVLWTLIVVTYMCVGESIRRRESRLMSQAAIEDPDRLRALMDEYVVEELQTLLNRMEEPENGVWRQEPVRIYVPPVPIDNPQS
jgi:hypothetical protein